VPEGHYEEENMKATVVPNRNKIFASITQAVALSVATSTKEKTDIALGIHAGDHAIYPDCRQEWRDADDHAFRMGNWDSELVGYYTPYLKLINLVFYKTDKSCVITLKLNLMKFISAQIHLINQLNGFSVLKLTTYWKLV
jgi:7-cyano-7-deazaguanine synthase in queuosine biosynthesis